MSDEPLRWEKNKHDAKLAASHEAQDAMLRGEVMGKLSKVWNQKVAAITHKRKAPRDAIAGLLDKLVAEMEGLVRSQCHGRAALKDFEDMTISLLQEKAELLRLTRFNERNCLTPYIPSFARVTSDPKLPRAAQPAVVRYTFNTEAEFRDIPPVRNASLKEGFTGFVLEQASVWAVFDDTESVPVGTVVNGLGMEKLPGVKQWQKALKKHRRK